jgi:hypothetical protein
LNIVVVGIIKKWENESVPADGSDEELLPGEGAAEKLSYAVTFQSLDGTVHGTRSGVKPEQRRYAIVQAHPIGMRFVGAIFNGELIANLPTELGAKEPC